MGSAIGDNQTRGGGNRSTVRSEGVCSEANCVAGVCASVGKQAISSSPAAATKMTYFRIHPCLVSRRGVKADTTGPKWGTTFRGRCLTTQHNFMLDLSSVGVCLVEHIPASFTAAMRQADI